MSHTKVMDGYEGIESTQKKRPSLVSAVTHKLVYGSKPT